MSKVANSAQLAARPASSSRLPALVESARQEVQGQASFAPVWLMAAKPCRVQHDASQNLQNSPRNSEVVFRRPAVCWGRENTYKVRGLGYPYERHPMPTAVPIDVSDGCMSLSALSQLVCVLQCPFAKSCPNFFHFLRGSQIKFSTQEFPQS